MLKIVDYFAFATRPGLGCLRTGDCRQNYLKGALKMYGTFYLGKNPNGKFFVTNQVTNVAQQLADENGTEFHEIVEGKKLTLKKVVLETGAEKPAKVEIKTLMVDGKAVKVQTSSQAEKERIRDEKAAEQKAEAETAEKDEG